MEGDSGRISSSSWGEQTRTYSKAQGTLLNVKWQPG